MIFKQLTASVSRLFGIATGLVFITGCQTYEPKPLDLTSHSQHWHSRTPSNKEVRKFALSLTNTNSPRHTEFNPMNGLTLSEGELVALVFNPDLRMARMRASVAQATAPYAGRWQDPIFNLNILKIADSIPDPWYISSALSLTVPISGRLNAEKLLAASEVYAELERIAESEWNVIRNLRESWLSWSAYQLKMEQTKAIIHELDAIVESTALLAELGELLKTEAILFAIERETRRTELDRIKADLAEEAQTIRSLLGLSPNAPLELLPSLSIESTFSKDDSMENRNPTLARLRSEYEVAERTLHREVRKQYPDLTIGPQIESDAGQSRIGFVGGIPLPILNSNRGGIAGARAERDLARAAFETTYERITGHLAGLRTRLKGIHIRRIAMETTIVPMVDQQLTDAYQLLELGEGSSLVMLESFVRAYEVKLKLIDTQLDDSLTQNAIHFLMGPSANPTGTRNNTLIP